MTFVGEVGRTLFTREGIQGIVTRADVPVDFCFTISTKNTMRALVFLHAVMYGKDLCLQ